MAQGRVVDEADVSTDPDEATLIRHMTMGTWPLLT